MTIRKENESIEEKTVPVKISTAVWIVISTISIQASLTGVYMNLKSDLKDLSGQQNTQNQLNTMRFGNIESKQAEDHEWLRSLAHRLNTAEQQNGAKAEERTNNEFHK